MSSCMMRVGLCFCVCLIMKPYGLSVSLRAASTGSCDAGKELWDETWVAYSCLLLLSLLFSFPFCSSSFLLLSSAHPSALTSPLFPFLLISSDVLSFLFYPSVPTFFTSLLLLSVTSTFFLILLSFCHVSLFCAYTHSSSPLSSTLVPVVFASASFSSNEINWCEMIHFHIFLWNPEKRLGPDLNLHVRNGI